MKKQGKQSRLISLLFITTMLIQSCSIYHTKTASVAEASSFGRKVKIETTDGNTYILKELEQDEGKLMGVARLRSRAAKRFYQQALEEGSKTRIVRFMVPEEVIREVHLKNYPLSTVGTILLSAIAVFGVLAIIGGIIMDDFTFGSEDITF